MPTDNFTPVPSADNHLPVPPLPSAGEIDAAIAAKLVLWDIERAGGRY